MIASRQSVGYRSSSLAKRRCETLADAQQVSIFNELNVGEPRSRWRRSPSRHGPASMGTRCERGSLCAGSWRFAFPANPRGAIKAPHRSHNSSVNKSYTHFYVRFAFILSFRRAYNFFPLRLRDASSSRRDPSAVRARPLRAGPERGVSTG